MCRRYALLCTALLLTSGQFGCSSTGTAPLMGLPSATELGLNSLPALATITPATERIVGKPTDVYTRIARGVLTCWFGEAGPLKKKYIYHAEAKPASEGGDAKIEVFVRDPKAANQKALRAYKISIFEAETKTRVSIENFKIEDPLSSQLNQDVERWAADEAGCGQAAVVTGWDAKQEPKKKTRKPRKKARAKK